MTTLASSLLPNNDLAPIQRYFQQWPLQVESDAIRGRFVTARSSISVGALLFESRVYARGVSASCKRRVCHECAKYHDGTGWSLKCSPCDAVFYCDAQCATANAAQHKHECALFRRCRSRRNDRDTSAMMRAVIAVYARTLRADAETSDITHSEESDRVTMPTSADFDRLIDHSATALVDTILQTYWSDVKKDLIHIFGASDVLRILQIFAKIESNAFELYAQIERETEDTVSAHSSEDVRTRKSVGRCVYPTASYFNHSCEPNAEVVQRGDILSVYALRNIDAAEEVTLSYIDGNRPYTSRQHELKQTFHFECICERCQFECYESHSTKHTYAASHESKENRHKTYKSKHGPQFKKKKVVPTVSPPHSVLDFDQLKLY